MTEQTKALTPDEVHQVVRQMILLPGTCNAAWARKRLKIALEAVGIKASPKKRQGLLASDSGWQVGRETVEAFVEHATAEQYHSLHAIAMALGSGKMEVGRASGSDSLSIRLRV